MSKKKASLSAVDPLAIGVPVLVEDVCSYLEKNALTSVGLFREAGSLSETLALKRKFASAKGKVSLSNSSKHSIASLLSHYLLDLEPPLLTYSLYDAWIGCMEPEELQLECIRCIVYLLPPGRTCILQRVIRLLVAVADHHKVLPPPRGTHSPLGAATDLQQLNKMSASDLAVTLGSCLLHPQEQSPVSQYQEASSVHSLVATFISQYDKIFMDPIMQRPQHPEEMPAELLEVLSKAREDSKADLGPKGSVSSRVRKDLGKWMQALPRLAEEAQAARMVRSVPKKESHAVLIQACWRRYVVRRQLRGLNVPYQIAYNHATDALLRNQQQFIWTVSKAVREFESKLKLVRYSKLSKLSLSKKPAPQKKKKKDKEKPSAELSFSEQEQVKERELEQDLRNAESEVMAVLVNLRAILEVRSMQMETITARRNATWPLVVRIGTALEESVGLFIVYSAYIDMYTRVQKLTSSMLRLAERSPSLQEFLSMEAGSYGFTRTLSQLLDMPFEHGIAGWEPMDDLVGVVLQYNEDRKDTAAVLRTHCTLERVRAYFGGMLSWVTTERLIETETVLFGAPFSLSSRKRRLIREGTVLIASESRYLFLFNDICVVAKKNTARDLGAVYRYQYHIDLDGCMVEDSSTENSFTIRTEERAFLLTLRSQETKMPWLADFQRAATNWNRTVFGLPLSICVQRHGQDEGVPVLVSNITRHLIKKDDTSLGVVCAPQDREEMRTLKANIEKTKKLQKLRFSRYSSVAVVNALKCFLLELPAPLLAVELCSEFPLFEDRAAMTVPDIDAMQELVGTLPEGRRLLLHHVIRFLANCDADVALVAASWSHCIVRSRKRKLDALLSAQPGEAILCALLSNYSAIFDEKREMKITRRRKKAEPSMIELRKSNRQPRKREKSFQKKENVARRLMRSASSTLLSNRM